MTVAWSDESHILLQHVDGRVCVLFTWRRDTVAPELWESDPYRPHLKQTSNR